MENKLVIKINDKFDLVVEKNFFNNKCELNTYIFNKEENLIHQDISIVRLNEYNNGIEALLYADCNDEDFTDKVNIDIWEGEEN